ncbi:MAG: peptidyl-alpha-hydroxyglycine alpha-amidating lyase family protein [Bryobacteraceae bacterium]
MRLVTFVLVLASVLCTQCLSPLCAAEVPAPYKVVHGWPKLPEGFVMGSVSGIAVDSGSHVYVFHRGPQPVLCFDGKTGKLISSWGGDVFKTPHGLKLDKDDNLWVTDVGHHQIFKFNRDGKLLMAVGTKGVPGLDATHFDKPTDVAVAPNGEFYVSDGYGNSRVAKFSAKGEFLFDWGRKGSKPGEFDTPHSITLDKQGRVYVADRSNARIQVFDAKGKFLHEWKSAELGRPWSVFFGPDGNLNVTDGGDVESKPVERNRILKLDLQGKIIEKWGTYGRYDGQFVWAHIITVAPNGDAYIGDIQGMRVQKFVRANRK